MVGMCLTRVGHLAVRCRTFGGLQGRALRLTRAGAPGLTAFAFRRIHFARCAQFSRLGGLRYRASFGSDVGHAAGQGEPPIVYGMTAEVPSTVDTGACEEDPATFD